MRIFVAFCLLSIALSVEVPRDVTVNLLSGSSVSLSWIAVQDASSYTLDVKPTPTMSNDYSVSTEYAFIDGLVAGQEYSIRVASVVRGVKSSFSEEVKVLPSGAPIIAPAPHVMSFDENSVTVSRHHMRNYRNGNDLTKVVVLIQEEGKKEKKEVEYPYSLPLKITGLKTGKTYVFAWRFANIKGMQQTYSRFCPAVTLVSPTTPESPKNIHILIHDSLVNLRWRNVENSGRPVMKYNVRISDLTNHVLFEKASYKNFATFRGVNTVSGVKAEVNVMTAAGTSEWSQPVVYDPNHPSVEITRVFTQDAVAIAHLNLTSSGTVMCSYYSSSIRPKHVSKNVHHAGQSRILLDDLIPNTSYSIDCSLHVPTGTVMASRHTFVTSAHTESHLVVTDVEPFATFARISLKSDTLGEVRCMPMRRHFGDVSLRSFDRFALRFSVKDVDMPQMFIADNLHRGSEYRLKCMMQHELRHALLHADTGARRLSDISMDISFSTLLQSLPVTPKVLQVIPDTATSLPVGSIVTLLFDMPVKAGLQSVLLGNSSATSTAVSFQTVTGHTASFRMPAITWTKAYLKVPAGAVQSQESSSDNEEFAFAADTFWTVTRPLVQCNSITPVVTPVGGVLRFSCNDSVQLLDTCQIIYGGFAHPTTDVIASGTTVAVRLADLAVGQQYAVVSDNCGVDLTATITTSTELAKPMLVSATPAQTLFVGETYQFTLQFDQPIHLEKSAIVTVVTTVDPSTAVHLLPTAGSRTIMFEFTVPSTFAGKTIKISMVNTDVKDDLNRPLSANVAFTRFVSTSCGPAYLASLAKQSDVCKCKRSSDMCECHCGELGASMSF